MTTKNIQVKPAYTKYACTAGIPNLGMARCQTPSLEGDRCEEHQKNSDPAARPTVVMLKMHLPNKFLSPALLGEKSGWRYQSATQRNPTAVSNRAIEARRNPNQYRRKYDSGSEVFCGDGAINIAVPQDLLGELYGRMHISEMLLALKADKRDQFLLQIVFSKEATIKMPAEFARHPEEIMGLMETITWGKVYIYCNLPKPDGTVLHTVNMTGSTLATDLTPRGSLGFRDGDWGVTPSD